MKFNETSTWLSDTIWMCVLYFGLALGSFDSLCWALTKTVSQLRARRNSTDCRIKLKRRLTVGANRSPLPNLFYIYYGSQTFASLYFIHIFIYLHIRYMWNVECRYTYIIFNIQYSIFSEKEKNKKCTHILFHAKSGVLSFLQSTSKNSENSENSKKNTL